MGVFEEDISAVDSQEEFQLFASHFHYSTFTSVLCKQRSSQVDSSPLFTRLIEDVPDDFEL